MSKKITRIVYVSLAFLMIGLGNYVSAQESSIVLVGLSVSDQVAALEVDGESIVVELNQTLSGSLQVAGITRTTVILLDTALNRKLLLTKSGLRIASKEIPEYQQKQSVSVGYENQ